MPQSEGNWWYGVYFTLAHTAKEWGVQPSDLGFCDPEDDLTVMIAYSKARSHMADYEQQQKAKKKKGRGLFRRR